MAIDLLVEDLERAVYGWTPPRQPHCSNCRHAIVTGAPVEPMTYCALGYGKEQPLVVLIRRRFARQFRPAAECPAFDSMSDPEGTPRRRRASREARDDAE